MAVRITLTQADKILDKAQKASPKCFRRFDQVLWNGEGLIQSVEGGIG